MPETEIRTHLIELAFQKLLNTKHLYQTVDVDFEPAIREEATEIFRRRNRDSIGGVIKLNPKKSTLDEVRQELFAELDALDWFCGILLPVPPHRVCFSLLPVGTLCSVCDEVTAFNLWDQDEQSVRTITLGTKGEQVFTLTLQCQGCRSRVVVFMVRRKGRKIQLVGRSEFEEVKAPSYIPKEHKGFYSQALIAFNCGRFLPALFLLRTLIEQYMRAVTRRADLRGDELCDEYNKTLDEDFKSRFPSLKDVYGKLSDALHRADPNESLFKAELERVGHHFEGRDLFARVKKTNKPNGRAPASAAPHASRERTGKRKR
jgi:hypothetical protein